jgi:hypothetical protein
MGFMQGGIAESRRKNLAMKTLLIRRDRNAFTAVLQNKERGRRAFFVR